MATVLVAGGGILGTFHALEALSRGFEVIHFEASAEPAASTPRSLGVLHFSRCAPGVEMRTSLRAAARWHDLAAQVDSSLIRRVGSTVVATDEADSSTLDGLASLPDAPQRRWRFLGHDSLREVRPALAGQVVGALDSDLDVVVEPRRVLEGLRAAMGKNSRYSFKGGVDIRDVGPGALTASNGRTYRGDLSVLCPGSRSDLAVSVMRRPNALRAVRVQVAQTERLGRAIGGPFSDMAALAQSGVGLATLGADHCSLAHRSDPRVGETEVSLTCVQRRSGALTIGETRDYVEPFGFEVSQRPLAEMLGRLRVILGVDPPPLVGQWAGCVMQCTDSRLWLRDDLDETTTLVTGVGVRGITLAPAIASETLDWMVDGIDSGATHPGSGDGTTD